MIGWQEFAKSEQHCLKSIDLYSEFLANFS